MKPGTIARLFFAVALPAAPGAMLGCADILGFQSLPGVSAEAGAEGDGGAIDVGIGDASGSDGSHASDGNSPSDGSNASDGSDASDGSANEEASSSDGPAGDAPSDAPETDAETGAGDASDASDAGPVMNCSDGGPPLSLASTSPSIAVTVGSVVSFPTVKLTAEYEGAAVAATFAVDKPQIGTIDSAGLFTPAALAGGIVTVTATYGCLSATAKLIVKLSDEVAGDPSFPDGGPANYGQVGGQGEGAPATPTQVTVLTGTPAKDPSVAFLYPYDGTVFPQGLVPPLLQWTIGSHAFDGIYIHLSETYYDYKGYFAAPTTPGLDGGPGGPFQNHPVPPSVWSALAASNAGEPVSVSLVFSQGSAAVGPITESWLFAAGPLKGVIYYDDYGHALDNYYGALGPNPSFGAGVFGLQPGQTASSLVAGSSSEDQSGCRACHEAAAGGSVLIAEQGETYANSSIYALTPSSSVENVPSTNNGTGVLAWSAPYPDGTFLFSNDGNLAGASSRSSALYSTADGTAIAAQGLGAGNMAIGAMTPTFSPDGTHAAFNFFAGFPEGLAADQASLAAIDFAAATKTFSNFRVLTTPPAGEHDYTPSFFPTNDGVVFELETQSDGREPAGTRGFNDNSYDTTEDGAHGELWWVDLATQTSTRLDSLNGLVTSTGQSYLPPHPTAVSTPDDAGVAPNPDTTLEFSPSVCPIASGGYAWVVFVSRRLYGNVMTINPYWSDPRNEDLSSTPSPKKLWVAAIDLNPKPGTDPSHPAFYLPAQDLLATIGRPTWVAAPCQADGTSCNGGDECCGGYCRPGDAGLACTSTVSSCSEEYEKCATSTDCCGGGVGLACIDARCARSAPP